VAGLPLLRAAPAHGGAQAQQIEVRRLRELAAAGVPVPQVLHVEPDFFVQRYMGDHALDKLLRQPQAALWWQRGLQALVALHAACALSKTGIPSTLPPPRPGETPATTVVPYPPESLTKNLP